MSDQFLPQPPQSLPYEPEEIEAHAQHGKAQHDSIEDDSYDYAIKTLLAWQAPGRPFRKRGKEYHATVLLIAFLFVVIAFLFHEYLLMLVIGAVVLLNYALVTVPPHNFHYRISSEGITVEDHMYLWQELYDFYFKKKEGVDVVHIRTVALIPGELTLTLGPVDRAHVQSALLPYLPYREVMKQTFMEKSGDWLSKNFPLEKKPPHKVAS